jgi:hypothetical protein
MLAGPEADETVCVRRGARTGAGSVSSCRWVWLRATASWCAVRGGKVVASAGVVVPGDCPPDGVGTASQYWLAALADSPPQLAPGVVAAPAGAAAAANTTSISPRAGVRMRRARDTWIAGHGN